MDKVIQTELRLTFIEKQTDNCNFQELYRLFKYFYLSYCNGDFSSKVEVFVNCLWYLKTIINKFKPEDCIKFICAIEHRPFSKECIEDEYISLMHQVTLIEIYYEYYKSASHWAKKTLEMVDYFHPNLNEATKQKILNDKIEYQDCSRFFDEYQSYYNSEFHKEIMFDWEKSFYNPSNNVNDNHRYMLFT